MSTIWKKWIQLSKRLVGFLATILLTVIYLLFIIPLGIFLQLFFKNALRGHRYHFRKNTYWIKRKKTTYDLTFAKEQ